MHFLLIFLAFFAIAEARQCYFLPPQGWEIAQLKTPSPHVKIGFIGKGSTDFRPSLNLAFEEVDVSLKDYIKAVKELQLSDPTNKWRDLGKFPTKAGIGRLTEMSNTSPWGEIKIYQAIFVEKGMAYILTAAVLKEDFPKFQAELMKAFRSLSVTDDLCSAIPDAQERGLFQSFYATLGTNEDKEEEWDKLQKQVGSLSQLGPYWQFLALQEGRTKIYAANTSEDSTGK